MKKLLALLFAVSSVALYAGCGCSCHNGSSTSCCSSCSSSHCCKETEVKDQQQPAAEDDKCACNHPKPPVNPQQPR